jgi:hypothetical protein
VRRDALLVAAAAVAARVAYLVLVPGATNADDAVTALMARRILAGHGYVWFAGQDYMGAGEQYLQALAVAVLPDSLTAVRLVDILLSGGVAALGYGVARAVHRERARALTAGLVFAVGPAFTLHFGTRSLGGYVLAQLAGVAALLLALHLGRSPARVAALGVAVGVVLYESPTALCLAVPALLWSAPVLRSRPGLLLPLVAGLSGALTPAVGWTLAHQRWPGLPGGQPPSTPLDRLGNALGPVARELLGVTGPQDSALVPGGRVVVVALGVAWLVAAWRRRHGLGALLTGRVGQCIPLDAVLLTVPVAVALHVAAPSAWYAGTPRYAFALAPAIAVLLAGLVPRGRIMPAALLVSAVAALSVAGASRHRGTIDEADVARIADALAARQVAVARAGYWTAVPLALAARGRFRVVQVGGLQRFPELRGSTAPAASWPAGVAVARAGEDPPGRPPPGAVTWSCGPFRVWQLPRPATPATASAASGARPATASDTCPARVAPWRK